jgi:hypothetical protein
MTKTSQSGRHLVTDASRMRTAETTLKQRCVIGDTFAE